MVMTTKDGKNRVILSHKDFLELVNEYMGCEAREYIDATSIEVASLERDLDIISFELESNQEKVEELLKYISFDICKVIDIINNSKRINKKKIVSDLLKIKEEIYTFDL